MFTRPRRKEAGTFRASIHDSARTFRLKLEGGLDATEAHEVEWSWVTAASTIRGRGFVIDLTGASSVDPAGRDLLVRMYENGAEFLASSPEMMELVSGITGIPPAEYPDRQDRRDPLRALRDFLVLAISLFARVKVSAN